MSEYGNDMMFIDSFSVVPYILCICRYMKVYVGI